MSTLIQAHDRFCMEKEVLHRQSAKTISWYRQTFKSLTRFKEVKEAEELTPQLFKEWYFFGHGLKWSPKTLANRVIGLSLFCDWLQKEGLLAKNPMDDLPRPRLPKRVPRHLSKQEAEYLIQVARNYPFEYEFERARAIAIIGMFIGTGIRREELRMLELRDVDLENFKVFIRSGKGNKDRLVPLPMNLVPSLRNYLKHRARLNRCNPYFWSSLRCDQIMGPRALKRLIFKLKQASGINFSAHKLRHTFAVLMLEGGCDIFSLSRMLGHSNIQTTTIYLTATVAHLKDQIQKHPLAF